MSTLDPHPSERSGPALPDPRFLVGQDRRGCWVAVEVHGLGGGLFRSRTDAVHYATHETRRRPDAVVVTTACLELGPWTGGETPES